MSAVSRSFWHADGTRPIFPCCTQIGTIWPMSGIMRRLRWWLAEGVVRYTVASVVSAGVVFIVGRATGWHSLALSIIAWVAGFLFTGAIGVGLRAVDRKRRDKREETLAATSDGFCQVAAQSIPQGRRRRS